MSGLHPIFAQALAPFTSGLTPQHPSAPSCPKGLEVFTYYIGDVELTCHMEYEAPCLGSRERGTGLQMEPDYDAGATLCAAYAYGGEVTDLLDDDKRAEIEIAFLEQEPDCDDEPDFDLDF